MEWKLAMNVRTFSHPKVQTKVQTNESGWLCFRIAIMRAHKEPPHDILPSSPTWPASPCTSSRLFGRWSFPFEWRKMDEQIHFISTTLWLWHYYQITVTIDQITITCLVPYSPNVPNSGPLARPWSTWNFSHLLFSDQTETFETPDQICNMIAIIRCHMPIFY